MNKRKQLEQLRGAGRRQKKKKKGPQLKSFGEASFFSNIKKGKCCACNEEMQDGEVELQCFHCDEPMHYFCSERGFCGRTSL